MWREYLRLIFVEKFWECQKRSNGILIGIKKGHCYIKFKVKIFIACRNHNTKIKITIKVAVQKHKRTWRVLSFFGFVKNGFTIVLVVVAYSGWKLQFIFTTDTPRYILIFKKIRLLKFMLLSIYWHLIFYQIQEGFCLYLILMVELMVSRTSFRTPNSYKSSFFSTLLEVGKNIPTMFK